MKLGQQERGDGESAHDCAGRGCQVKHNHADGSAGQAQGGYGAEKTQQPENTVRVDQMGIAHGQVSA